MGQVSISTNNINKPAPKWFRKAKKAIGILTVAANAMVSSIQTVDEQTKVTMQLWFTIGIGALLEAGEALLANGDDYVSNQAEKTN